MKNQQLIDRLDQLPAQIAEVSTQLMELQQKSQDLKNEQVDLELQIKMNILTEVDDNGKKVYSNAESRDAALSERAKAHPQLCEIAASLGDLDKQIQMIKINLEKLANEQRNIRSIMAFIASGSANDL
jgi:chromosome segregation ATPase